MIECDGGPLGPKGHAPADFNVMSHNMCLSVNVCRGCMSSTLIGFITAWQDDGPKTVCAFCGKPMPHLEDAVKLTSLRGMPLGEAWKKFHEENEEFGD